MLSRPPISSKSSAILLSSAWYMCCRAIILLESNLGMAELEELLTQIGDRDKVHSAAKAAAL